MLSYDHIFPGLIVDINRIKYNKKIIKDIFDPDIKEEDKPIKPKFERLSGQYPRIISYRKWLEKKRREDDYYKYKYTEPEPEYISIEEPIKIHNYFVDKYREIIRIFNGFVEYHNQIIDEMKQFLGGDEISDDKYLKELREYVMFEKIKFQNYDVIPDENIAKMINLMHNNMRDIARFSSQIHDIVSKNLRFKSTQILIKEMTDKMNSDLREWDVTYYRQKGGQILDTSNEQMDEISDKLKILGNIFQEHDKINNIVEFIQTGKIIKTLDKIKSSYQYHIKKDQQEQHLKKKSFEYYDYQMTSSPSLQIDPLEIGYEFDETSDNVVNIQELSKILDDKNNLIMASNKIIKNQIKNITEKYDGLSQRQNINYQESDYTFIDILNSPPGIRAKMNKLVKYVEKKNEFDQINLEINQYQDLVTFYSQGIEIIKNHNKQTEDEIDEMNIKTLKIRQNNEKIEKEYFDFLSNILKRVVDKINEKLENIRVLEIKNKDKDKYKGIKKFFIGLKTKININSTDNYREINEKIRENLKKAKLYINVPIDETLINRIYSEVIDKETKFNSENKINNRDIEKNLEILSRLENQKLKNPQQAKNINKSSHLDQIIHILQENEKSAINNNISTYIDWYIKYKEKYSRFIDTDLYKKSKTTSFVVYQKKIKDDMQISEVEIQKEKGLRFSSLDQNYKKKIRPNFTDIHNQAEKLNEQLFNTIREMLILIKNFDVTRETFELTNEEKQKITEKNTQLVNKETTDIFNLKGGSMDIYNNLVGLIQNTYTYIKNADYYIVLYIKALKLNRESIYHTFYESKVYKGLLKPTEPFDPILYLSYGDILKILRKLQNMSTNTYLAIIIKKYVLLCQNLIGHFEKKKDQYLYIDPGKKSFEDLLFLSYLVN